MKKLYTLLFFAVALSVNAQITNGGFESWTDGFPTAFSPSPYTVGATQSTEIVHSGLSSAMHTTPVLPASPTSVKIQNETALVVPGTSYTISYYFLDNTPLAKSRPWIYWLSADFKTIAADEAVFRPADYSTDSPDWQHYSVTVTAPEFAASLRFEMRSYAESGTAGGGVIYYDDMSVTSNLGVKQNKIAGLNVYPNPVTNGNLFISSDSNEVKAVTIFDVLGKQVLKANVTNQPMNVSSLSKGVYILKITEAGQTASRKLVIN